MSETDLPDGRKIFIAGEHEDHYDPDFFIYNDVIVRHPDDSIDVFGYPAEEFPPTDFHSATLVGGRVLLIGCLGYPEQRNPAETPCFSLDPVTMQIARLATSGENPGWIFEHSAELVESGILVRGGQVQRDSIAENCDDWLLDLRTRRWSRLTDRQWRQISIRRIDRKPNRLWEIRHHLFDLQHPQFRQLQPDSAQRFQETCQKFAQAGIVVNGELIDSLYSPPFDHLRCVRRESDRFNVYRIMINDVLVRYTEDTWSIDITVEGQLPEATLKALIDDLCEKLGRLENTKFIAVER